MTARTKLLRVITWSLLAVLLGFTALTYSLPQWIPMDHMTGGVSSFYHNGFYVSGILGNVPNQQIQIGDRIVSINGCSIEVWMNNQCPSSSPQQGEPTNYKVSRSGILTELSFEPTTLTAREMWNSFLPHLGPALFCLLFSIFLLIRRKKNSFTYRVALQLILFGAFFVYQTIKIPLLLITQPFYFWLYIGFIILIYSVLFANTLQFLLIFPKEIFSRKILSPLIQTALFLLPMIVAAVIYIGAGYSSNTVKNVLQWVSILISLEVLLIILAYVYHFVTQSRPLTKIRLRWIRLFLFFCALLLLLFIGYLNNQTNWLENYSLIIPQRNLLSLSDPYLLFFFSIPILLTAIIPHDRLLDINQLEKHTVFYSAALLVLVSVFFFLIWLFNQFPGIQVNENPYLLSLISGGIAFIITAIAYRPFSEVMDQWINRDQYHYEQTLPEIFLELNRNLTIQQISLILLEKIPQTLGIKKTTLLIKNPDSTLYLFVDNQGTRSENGIAKSHPIISYLAQTQAPILRYFHSPALHLGITAFMKKYESEVAIPLIFEGDLIGLYNLGEKNSKRPYSLTEVGLLNDVGQWAATVVHNISILVQKDDYSRSLERVVRQRDAELDKVEDQKKTEQKATQEIAEKRLALYGEINEEFRTPLSVLTGLSSILDTTRLDENQAGYAATMHTNIRRLENLFNHISTYALMEAGNFQVNLEEIFLDDFCNAVIRSNLMQNSPAQTRMSVFLTANTPVSILTDQTYLAELIAFSVTKATQLFESEKFVVKIDAQHWHAAEDELPPIAYPVNNSESLYRFSFEITPLELFSPDAQRKNEHYPRLIHKQQTIDDLLAEQICQKLGGEILKPENNTDGFKIGFAIHAEISPQTYPAFMAVHPRHLSKLSVCIVDHEENSRRRLTMQCESWGMTVYHSIALPPVVTPDILIINASAPEQLPTNMIAFYEQNHPFTILVRPNAALEIKPSATTVQEPTSPTAEHLYQLFTQTFVHREMEQTQPTFPPEATDDNPAAIEPPPSSYPLNILICETNPIEEELLQLQFNQIGQQSERFTQALDFLPEHLIKMKYDLLILQLQGRDQKELELIQKIKSNVPVPFQPFILAITANPVRFHRNNVLEVGADAVLLKPIKVEELKRILRQISTHLNANRPTRRAQDR